MRMSSGVDWSLVESRRAFEEDGGKDETGMADADKVLSLPQGGLRSAYNLCKSLLLREGDLSVG